MKRITSPSQAKELVPGGGTRVGECWVCADLTSETRPLERLKFSEKVPLRETFLENFLRFSKNFLPLERLFTFFFC